MAFNSAAGRAEYTASSGQTVFPFTFKIYLDGDIKVYLTPVGNDPDDVADLLTITTDYTVSIDGDNGGSITLVSGATTGDAVTLVRELDIDRLIEYQTNGDLLAETLNDDQDYQTYLIADKETENTRFIRLADTAQGVDTDLPAPISDAYFKWNSAGDGIENDTTIPTNVQLAVDSAAAAAVSETNAAASASAASTSETNAAASAASIDPTTLLHVVGEGGGNPEGYTATEIDEKAQLWQHQATTITPSADSDYTLTADENLFGRLVLVDGSWTATHNIIVDTTERSFITDNSSGTYTATVKTSAGTGIAVAAGATVWLLCDGTNVIESIDASEEPWVANDSRAKTALNASGTAPIYACRAWVNFNGTGTVAIRASGNVSSVTDVGAGRYRPNYITAIEDANGSINVTFGAAAGGNLQLRELERGTTTSQEFFITVDGTATGADVDEINFSITR